LGRGKRLLTGFRAGTLILLNEWRTRFCIVVF
jgi:hypothetical protein